VRPTLLELGTVETWTETAAVSGLTRLPDDTSEAEYYDSSLPGRAVRKGFRHIVSCAANTGGVPAFRATVADFQARCLKCGCLFKEKN
jgi:hypothetical protein